MTKFISIGKTLKWIIILLCVLGVITELNITRLLWGSVDSSDLIFSTAHLIGMYIISIILLCKKHYYYSIIISVIFFYIWSTSIVMQYSSSVFEAIKTSIFYALPPSGDISIIFFIMVLSLILFLIQMFKFFKNKQANKK